MNISHTPQDGWWRIGCRRPSHWLNGPTTLARLAFGARETVRERFLLTRLMEEWLDLIGAFEPRFRLRDAAE
jgi:hypothetical protein